MTKYAPYHTACTKADCALDTPNDSWKCLFSTSIMLLHNAESRKSEQTSANVTA